MIAPMALPLLLLPGLDGTAIFFEPLQAALPPTFEPRVVTYPRDGRQDYDSLLPIALAAAGDAPRFLVLGWSFGGPLALRLAAALPDRVAGVVLCATFVRAPRPWLRLLRFAAVGPVLATVRAAWRSRFLVTGYPSSSFREAKARTWRAVDAREIAARARAALDVDARPLLEQLRAPLLYLASSNDRVVPPRNAAEIAQLRPDIEFATLSGTHLALFTQAPRAAELLAGFAARHASPAAEGAPPA